MLAVTYGLQVRVASTGFYLESDSFSGYHIHYQTRVHAYRMDGGLYHIVSPILEFKIPI